MRIAILATGWAGFNDAACRELAALGPELLVVHGDEHATNTDYTGHRIGEYGREHRFVGPPAEGEVSGVVRDFAPDVVLMHSWHYPPFREAIKAVPEGTLRVLWMDNVWRNTARQWVGRGIAPVWVRPLFDAVMVPSDRSEFFARRLGFGEGEVIRGSLCADSAVFAGPPRDGADLAAARRFLACLRLVHHKGADVLAEAYRRYRSRVAEPWDLEVVGIGELAGAFDGLDGVTMAGFCQPEEVAERMRAASCLVNPSREEPYGVVLHEAALSALPIISTYFVGAAPFFAQDGANGWTVPRNDAEALAVAMSRMSAVAPERLGAMSAVSHGLGGRITSPVWAQNLEEQLRWRLAGVRS